MPEINHYTVTQIRMVKVTANDAFSALEIAAAAFEHGQNANGEVVKDNLPEGVWGNTDTKIETVDVQVKWGH